MDCVGSYSYCLDAKNRVFLPAKYREFFQGEFYVCQGADQCLYIYNKEKWEPVSEKIKAKSGTPAGRMFKTNFYSKVDKPTLDGQGRFIIKPMLAQYASLEKDVLILGAGDRFEIWNPECYAKASANTPTADEIGVEDIF